MNNPSQYITTLTFLASLGSSLGAELSLPNRMPEVPRNGEIRLTEYGYRNWGPELVRYRIDPKQFPQRKSVLLGPDGKAVPFQIHEGTLSFVAELAKGQTVEYKLQASNKDRSRENSNLGLKKSGKFLEITNDRVAVRVPAPQEKTFSKPIPATEVPAPLGGFKQQGHDWMGGSHFQGERKILSYAFRMIGEGPASMEYEARYRFSPTGEYACRIQVVNGLPYALVTEEFDFGSMTDGHDFLVLDITSGWSPDTYRYIECAFGGGESPFGTGGIYASNLTSYVHFKTAAWESAGPSATPHSYQPGSSSMVLVDRLTHTGAFGPRGAIGFSSGSQSTYILPMRGGSWRRGMALTCWNEPGSGIKMALPIGVRPLDNYLEVSGDGNAFATLTHDPALPVSYGRRSWALCGGLSDKEVADVRLRAGVIGLDRYKNWTLHWDADASKTFPRAFMTTAQAKRLKDTITSHPDKDRLQSLYLISGKPADAINSAQVALKRMRGRNWEHTWAYTDYRKAEDLLYMLKVEDALSCPSLPADLRDQLRLALALDVYFFAEPDITQLGTGAHLGTWNMRIGRVVGGTYGAALLPDHPLYDYWMSRYRDLDRYLLATSVSPGGGWYEPPLYSMYGPQRWFAVCAQILRNTGVADLNANGYLTKFLQYNADITLADPRYPNHRILPGLGHGGNTLEAMFGIGVGAIGNSDPTNAAFFNYMHRLNSVNGLISRSDWHNADYSYLYLPDVGEHAKPLVTTYIPGFGVSFRAHCYDPNETAMIFRCGYTRSHWPTDDQSVILYGKGAPLAPGHADQYSGSKAGNIGTEFTQCRLVDAAKEPPFGRMQTDVQDYGFGANADYALGRMYFSAETLGDGKGEMDWRRHILFLKSAQPTGPNYFVMRDSFTGYDGAAVPPTGRKAWWYWLTLDTADLTTVNGTAFDASQVPVERVIPESQWPTLTGNTIEMGTQYGASTWFWFDTPTTPKLQATIQMRYGVAPADYQTQFAKLVPSIPQPGSKEQRTVYRMEGNADTGFFYVAYPRKGDEAAPVCTRLAPGCLKIVTSEAADYVFIGDGPFDFNQEGVVFSGKAGAVRVFRDHVVFCMNSGTGKIGYKGHLYSGNGPFERSVPNDQLIAGTVDVGGMPKNIRTVEIGQGITVRGEEPFKATLDGNVVRIHTEGRARHFIVEPFPDWLMNPQFTIDGQEWLCFPSHARVAGGINNGITSGQESRKVGCILSTLDGSHDLELRQRTWVSPWDSGLTRTVGIK